MNYYYDTEFLEGTQDKRFLGFKYGTIAHTIDLISIGIISEDGREYYAISKDFNMKEAWNRNDLDPNHKRNYKQKDNYWIRENVLKPIFEEWKSDINSKIIRLGLPIALNGDEFNYRNFKECIKSVGKSNKQIAEEVYDFCKPTRKFDIIKPITVSYTEIKNPVLYGYYSSYDHVALCWLFGKMIDLPKGFPMYTVDLKQMMDEKVENYSDHFSNGNESFETKLSWIKNKDNYPKQENEHNALADARWNKKLHEFLIQVN